jgi:hypothetical protein
MAKINIKIPVAEKKRGEFKTPYFTEQCCSTRVLYDKQDFLLRKKENNKKNKKSSVRQ